MKKKRRAGNPRRLLFPVICICNDAFAPVLRPLRAIAECISVPSLLEPGNLQPLVRRLSQICELEGLTGPGAVDTHGLMTLVEMTDGDIRYTLGIHSHLSFVFRSCLNTLQFAAQNGTRALDASALCAGLASKDLSKPLFSIWESVFCHLKTASRRTTTAGSSNGEDRFIQRLMEVIDARSDDYARILLGCFENYPQARGQLVHGFGATGGDKVDAVMDWLSFADRVDTLINRQQAWSLAGFVSTTNSLRYSAYPIIAFHAHFAGVKLPTLVYPKADFQVSTCCSLTSPFQRHTLVRRRLSN